VFLKNQDGPIERHLHCFSIFLERMAHRSLIEALHMVQGKEEPYEYLRSFLDYCELQVI
jgi:hypothetical protein